MGNAQSGPEENDESWQPGLAYYEDRKRPTVSQFKPLSARQTKNRSGAYVWQVNDMMKLQRFIFLGSDTSFSYKATEFEPKRDNAQCIDRLIGNEKGKEVVEFIKEVSLSGRAAKQQPTMFALAICARSNDPETKKAAYQVLNDICRIPTHLFLFINYCEKMSSGTGWGRAHRRAINGWYDNKSEKPKNLGRLVTKYRSRNDWSHRDVFRLAHIKTKTPGLKVVARYVIKGVAAAENLYLEEFKDNEEIRILVDYLKATEEAKRCTDEDRMVQLISGYGLEREHLTTQLLNSKKVWEALVKTMGMTAMIRNLNKLTMMKLCEEGSKVEVEICSKLTNVELLKKERVHPFNVLVAMKTYEKGRGEKGSLSWIPNKKVIGALDQAYHLSFASVEPTGKRYLLAIDVSGSMNVPCVGSQSVTCRDASAAMMMVTARTEKNYDVVAFSHKLMPMKIEKTDNLIDVVKKSQKLPFGGTDCALPMIWAQEQKKVYDVFIVYTDSETWYGKVHPSRALQDYRVHMGNPEAKLIVAGMASNGFTIADPDDYGMLDIVGFDAGATQTMAKFSIGEI